MEFDERDEQKDNSDDSQTFVIDEYLTNILSATWYPESYSDMIKTGRIDLGAMSHAAIGGDDKIFTLDGHQQAVKACRPENHTSGHSYLQSLNM